MARSIEVPPGSQYGVMPRHGARQLPHAEPFGTYFFGNLEDTVNFVTVNGLTFCCDVIRVAGDVLVWPLHTPGGSA